MLSRNKHTKTKPKPTVGLFICVCILLCATVVHKTAQNSSDNLPSSPPDSRHWSDDVCWRGGDSEVVGEQRVWPVGDCPWSEWVVRHCWLGDRKGIQLINCHLLLKGSAPQQVEEDNQRQPGSPGKTACSLWWLLLLNKNPGSFWMCKRYNIHQHRRTLITSIISCEWTTKHRSSHIYFGWVIEHLRHFEYKRVVSCR